VFPDAVRTDARRATMAAAEPYTAAGKPLYCETQSSRQGCGALAVLRIVRSEWQRREMRSEL